MHAFKNSNVTSSNGNGNPADGIEKYSKNMLNSYYLQDWVMVKQQCLFGTLWIIKVCEGLPNLLRGFREGFIIKTA